jgi:hypothetical protein
VTLSAVAESTKIKQSLLAGLERGDVSGWPRGIFRRAFVRAYATSIGLSPSAVLVEFSKLFPEDGESPAEGFDSWSGGGELRLTLAPDEARISRATIQRLLAALLDLAALVAISAPVSYFTGAGVWLVTAVTALIYYPAATAWTGRTAASWWLQRSRGAGTKHTESSRSARPPQVGRLQIVFRRSAARGPRPVEVDSERPLDASPARAARR